jgi:alginate O-acetyltransferase complex protein AlgJ
MLRASGTIKAIAAPPVPGSAPYKDHIIAMQLVDLKDAQDKPIIGSAVVFIWSMRDQKLTEAARWRAGDRVTLTLQPWADVEQKYGTINRRELQDDALLMADPCWGEQATSP